MEKAIIIKELINRIERKFEIDSCVVVETKAKVIFLNIENEQVYFSQQHFFSVVRKIFEKKLDGFKIVFALVFSLEEYERKIKAQKKMIIKSK